MRWHIECHFMSSFLYRMSSFLYRMSSFLYSMSSTYTGCRCCRVVLFVPPSPPPSLPLGAPRRQNGRYADTGTDIGRKGRRRGLETSPSPPCGGGGRARAGGGGGAGGPPPRSTPPPRSNQIERGRRPGAAPWQQFAVAVRVLPSALASAVSSCRWPQGATVRHPAPTAAARRAIDRHHYPPSRTLDHPRKVWLFELLQCFGLAPQRWRAAGQRQVACGLRWHPPCEPDRHAG